ncbi:MAG: dTDP-4-dehydrorhamnose reductase [Pseudomonadota bacterium]
MKILVAGNSGQVATSLKEAGLVSNHNVVCVGRPDLDVADLESVKQAVSDHHPDLVINAAAFTAVDAAETASEDAYLVNEQGAAMLALVTADLGLPIIHISTDYVFDGSLRASYAESDDVSPLGVYGASKLAGERAVIANNPKHYIFRTAWVYSPFGKNFVKTMLRLAESRDEISVVDDQIGSPTSALDIADALLEVATHLETNPNFAGAGVYHLGGTGIASWADLAEAALVHLQRRANKNVSIIRIESKDFPTPTQRPMNSRLNSRKAQRVFGVRLPEWRTSVRLCVDRILNGEL